MTELNNIVIYGRDNESANEIHFQTVENSNIAFGISVGVMPKVNEDCLGISISRDEILLAIADGHWGREASELAIDKTVEMFRSMLRPSPKHETRARFYALFEQINQELLTMAMTHPGALAPETTLIVCQLKEIQSEKYLYWSSFGDSYLFIFRNTRLIQVNSLNAYWLGMLSRMSKSNKSRQLTLKGMFGESRYIGVADGLETGIEKLQSGDIILLCTDGLIGSDEGVPESVDKKFRKILDAVGLLESKVSGLINSALDRGEKDNISCILTQID